ncbi:UNVERIFIED_CONTAM: hypothetical protein Scaly_0751400 [Sesamum calycinum]|uniref:Uncharacterized protein n=1 Tax=Sesamum calycinum TaxID=2727403 RepID=A0AAW2RAF6_9LAMI
MPPPPLTGQKRGYPFSSRERSPDREGASFAKLFVGSVPRTATEEDGVQASQEWMWKTKNSDSELAMDILHIQEKLDDVGRNRLSCCWMGVFSRQWKHNLDACPWNKVEAFEAIPL